MKKISKKFVSVALFNPSKTRQRLASEKGKDNFYQ